jgi:hypothetical protein
MGGKSEFENLCFNAFNSTWEAKSDVLTHHWTQNLKTLIKMHKTISFMNRTQYLFNILLDIYSDYYFYLHKEFRKKWERVSYKGNNAYALLLHLIHLEYNNLYSAKSLD